MILKLVTEPNKILRASNKRITKAELPVLQKFFDDMIESMHEYQGVGIAATQVGHNVMAAIINKDALDFKEKKLHEKWHGIDFPIINPIIKSHSWGKETDTEGCLSVPGYYGDVERYKKIMVECLDRNGAPLKFRAEGFFARVLQHEIDHLNKTLYIDKATNMQKTDAHARART